MITPARAEKILQLIRETVQGIQALQNEGKSLTGLAGGTFRLLANAVFLLDAYLTQMRSTKELREKNTGCFVVFLTKSQSVSCLLADQKTHLILRWPTLEDSRVVYPIAADESTASIDLLRRWKRIDNVNSEAVEFPSRSEHGKA